MQSLAWLVLLCLQTGAFKNPSAEFAELHSLLEDSQRILKVAELLPNRVFASYGQEPLLQTGRGCPIVACDRVNFTILRNSNSDQFNYKYANISDIYF